MTTYVDELMGKNSSEKTEVIHTFDVLTDEQKKEYLDNPFACPYCGSEDVRWGELAPEDYSIFRSCKCKTCGKKWDEEYSLNSVYGNDE